MDAMTEIMRALWIGGLAATPLALGVGLVCRVRMWSAATKHTLWLAVLASFVTPVIGVFVWRPDWFGTERLLGAAENVIKAIESATPEEAKPVIALTPSASAPVEKAPAGRAPVERAPNEKAPVSTFVGPVLLPALQPENAARFAMDTSGLVPIESGPSPHAGFSVLQAPMGTQMGTGMGTGMGTPLGTVSRATPLGLAPAMIRSDVAERPARARIDRSAAGENRIARREAAAPADREVPPVEEKKAKSAGQLRTIAGGLIAVRDWLASASPIPMTLWLGVAGVLFGARLIRTVRAGRLIRVSEPADVHVRAMVRSAAEQIGLSRVPEARMVDDAVSPMIWCGLRPKLILPRGLWNALDQSSQRAVVVHELAHVRRWDHVLCWLDLAIGSLYWWHPVSWWARRRLHDEAEASCDAWVVNTLPESRRAYATALLATKSFVSMKGRVSGPWLSHGSFSGGVGVLSGSAKKMARRITMVMTQKSASRVSLFGAFTAAGVVALGAFVMPGLACPPEEKAEKEAAKSKASGFVVITPDGKKVKSADGNVQFFGEAPALEAMRAKKASKNGAFAAPVPPVPPVAPVAPVPPMPLGTGAFFESAPTPRAMVIARGGQCGASRSKVIASNQDLRSGRTARAYVLAPGKAEALWELLSRSDVPIFVQRKGNAIVVWETDEQHPVVAGFVEIINPGGSAKGAVIRRDSGANSGGGLNSGEWNSAAGSGASVSASPSANQSAARANARAAQARAYEQALRELNTSRANVERNADRMRQEADRVREQQERLEEMTQRLQEQASELNADESRQVVEQAAKEMKKRAESARQRSRSTDEQVEQIERQIEKLEQRAEELEQKISEIDSDGDDEIAEIESDDMMPTVEMIVPDEAGEMGDNMGEMGDGVGDNMSDETEDADDEASPAAPVESPFTNYAPFATPAPIAAPSLPTPPSVAPIGASGSSFAPATAPIPSVNPVQPAAPTPAAPVPAAPAPSQNSAPSGQPAPAAASVLKSTRSA